MCCGNQRQQFLATERPRHGMRLAGGAGAAQPTRRQSVAYFEYVGPTGLTAVGANSGARYRFDRQTFVYAIGAILNNGLSAAFNNSAPAINIGDTTKNVAIGVSYSF